jgi:large subunit ribosomal protein L13
MNMKTYQPKQKDVVRNWHLIDAKGQILGRLATNIANLLMGKHKPQFSKHMDMGDYVVVLNAEKIEVTGRKRKQKLYRSHSGYPGGFKELAFEKMITEQPAKVIEHAVSGMLPGNRLKKKRMVRLRVVKGGENPYEKEFVREDKKK